MRVIVIVLSGFKFAVVKGRIDVLMVDLFVYEDVI
jgi:hypothetical protein